MSAPLDHFDASIAKAHESVGNGGGFLAVSGENRRSILFASEALQNVENQSAGGSVEIAGGLIGQEQPGRMYQSTSDRDALHLSSRKLMRIAVAEAVEFDPAQTLVGGGARIGDPGEQEGQFDIFVDREGVKELEGLKDEADFVAAENCQSSIVEAGCGRAIDEDGATIGKIHGAGKIEQGGFAAAAASDECEKFTGRDVEGNVIEGANGLAVGGVVFGDILQGEDGH
jgi:hypothetical protein